VEENYLKVIVDPIHDMTFNVFKFEKIIQILEIIFPYPVIFKRLSDVIKLENRPPGNSGEPRLGPGTYAPHMLFNIWLGPGNVLQEAALGAKYPAVQIPWLVF